MAAFKNLEDLVGDLGKGLQKLRAGALEPEELTPLVSDARELYDRLTLLRFKAHEFSYEVRRKAPQGGVDEGLAERQPVRPFRIGAAYQTSLIDAIEEVSREQAEEAEKQRLAAGTPELFDASPAVPAEPEAVVEPPVEVLPEPAAEVAAEESAEEVAEEVVEDVVEESEVEVVEEEPVAEVAPPQPLAGPPSEEQPQASLAETLEKRPITDLRTAFSLAEKYECIKMLFDDDALEFNRVLDALDDAGTFELAVHWLRQHVAHSGEWDGEDPVVIRFLEKVERRFL